MTRAPPPPPPPYSSTNNGHHFSDNNNTKFQKQYNPNGPPPPPPPPPPRGVIPTSNNGINRRVSSSDFVDHPYIDRRSDQFHTAALAYDQNFETRFRFTPIEYLPAPERWQPPPVHSRSSKHHLNVH